MERWRDSPTPLNVICEALTKLFELGVSVDDMPLAVVATCVASLENLGLVGKNWPLEATDWTAEVAILWDVMVERIIDPSLAVDLKPEFIPVPGTRLCVPNPDQKTSVATDTKLLEYFEDMLMLPVDIYWIPEAVPVRLESASCQLIVVIEARYAKEPVLPLPSTVDRMKLWALPSIVTITVLAVIMTVLVTVTEVGLAVSEVPVNSQLKSTLNDAELACGMLSCETWLLFVSLYKNDTKTENSNLKSSMTKAFTQYKDRTVSRFILFDFCRIVWILDEEIYSERNEVNVLRRTKWEKRTGKRCVRIKI